MGNEPTVAHTALDWAWPAWSLRVLPGRPETDSLTIRMAPRGALSLQNHPPEMEGKPNDKLAPDTQDCNARRGL